MQSKLITAGYIIALVFFVASFVLRTFNISDVATFICTLLWNVSFIASNVLLFLKKRKQ